MGKNRLNNIYKGMKSRCYNPKDVGYKYYGKRGITVCKEWMNPEFAKGLKGCNTKGWLSFKEWALTNGYQENLSIDRIDVNKGYSPDNCRWVSTKEQANNTRQNHLITYNGKTQTLMQWCEELNLCYNMIHKRIFERNWNIEDAFTTKDITQPIMITYNNKTQCLKDWCKELGLNYSTIYNRIITRHWPVDKAFNDSSHLKTIKITYNGRTQRLKDWCKEFNLDYVSTYKRIFVFNWSVNKAFETK